MNAQAIVQFLLEATDCFGNARRWASSYWADHEDTDDLFVVHGKVKTLRGTEEEIGQGGRVIDHAWVEQAGEVIDPTLQLRMPKARYYEATAAVPEAIYRPDQANVNMVRSGNLGPWTLAEVNGRYVWRADV